MAHCTHTPRAGIFPFVISQRWSNTRLRKWLPKRWTKEENTNREKRRSGWENEMLLPQCVNESEIVNCYAFEIVLARFRYIHSHAYVIDVDGFPTTTTILCYCVKCCFILKTGAFMACDKHITSSLDKTWWTLDTFNRLTDRWKRICAVCFCLIHHLSSQFSLFYAISNCLPANECDYHNKYICAQFWHRSFTKQQIDSNLWPN